jgi:hypothetical protein
MENSSHNKAISNFSTGSSSAHLNSEVFCSILVGDYESDLCVDIAGENAAVGIPLIGYECTGRWNQLFRLGVDLTVVSTQPKVIGRVRGNEDGDVHLCLAALPDGRVITDHCPSDQNRDSEEHFDAVKHFQLMPSAGTSYKKFMI